MKTCLRRYDIDIDAHKPTVIKLPRYAAFYQVMDHHLDPTGGGISVLMLVRPGEDMMNFQFGIVREEWELGYGARPSIILYTELGYHVTFTGQIEDVGG
jgi:hypothetical protein